jgi:hypothetical protein
MLGIKAGEMMGASGKDVWFGCAQRMEASRMESLSCGYDELRLLPRRKSGNGTRSCQTWMLQFVELCKRVVLHEL